MNEGLWAQRGKTPSHLGLQVAGSTQIRTLWHRCTWIQNPTTHTQNLAREHGWLLRTCRRVQEVTEDSYSPSRWCRCHWRWRCSSSSSSSGARRTWSVASPPATWSPPSPRRTRTARRSGPPRSRTSLQEKTNKHDNFLSLKKKNHIEVSYTVHAEKEGMLIYSNKEIYRLYGNDWFQEIIYIGNSLIFPILSTIYVYVVLIN